MRKNFFPVSKKQAVKRQCNGSISSHRQVYNLKDSNSNGDIFSFPFPFFLVFILFFRDVTFRIQDLFKKANPNCDEMKPHENLLF